MLLTACARSFVRAIGLVRTGPNPEWPIFWIWWPWAPWPMWYGWLTTTAFLWRRGSDASAPAWPDQAFWLCREWLGGGLVVWSARVLALLGEHGIGGRGV